ncbi:bifunctional metallophosphatase/5'-nucleotidase [Bacillus mesophilum]|uniref:Bifunctional metallophosphatase/5'-nucleotidase n=1 Tax=Bacillus mesophilum TaxID=1071718 RepID=A0A7V7RNN6_9BACI|nr:5'-nucleotidase C-terminal domain-containing protein [Bacillus mesophilum]KAB2334145.1 bifunctional metallophosphatase/5'-nucleotidase [Bacillus mesophilum]
MKKKMLLLFLTTLILCTLPPANTSARTKEVSFTIIHTNDTHSHLEQMPRLITVINSIRAEHKNTLLLNAGDVFIGTLYFSQFKGLASIPFMNKLKYDAMTFGNHEFDLKSVTLADFIKRADFPFVSSNIDFSADQLLEPLFVRKITANPQPGKIYPAIIKKVDDELVGIFGLTTEETPLISQPNQDLIFEDALIMAKKTAAQLEHLGVNKIIALSHLGFEEDQKLAPIVKGIDIIVGGHSHTKLEEPTVIYNGKDPVLIVQTGENAAYVGELSVSFDENGMIKKWNGSLLDVQAKDSKGNYKYEEDAWAKKQLSEADQELVELLQETVGYSLIPLNGAREDVRREETNLGNLIADSILKKANEVVPTQIAFQNSGGIRASIPEGKVVMRDVMAALPFSNTLSIVDITGLQLKEILEHSVSQLNGNTGQFLQVSGIRFTFNPQLPTGKRVQSVRVNDGGHYELLNPSKIYTAAVNSYLAGGGEGYDIFKRKKVNENIIETPFLDYEMLADYLKEHSPVAPRTEGRIQEVFTNEEL